MYAYLQTHLIMGLSICSVFVYQLYLVRAYALILSDSAPAWAIAHQAPLSIEFSRQEYWSGLPFHSPGDLPDSGIEPMSFVSTALAGRFFTS